MFVCVIAPPPAGSAVSELSSVAGDTDTEGDAGGLTDLLNTLRYTFNMCRDDDKPCVFPCVYIEVTWRRGRGKGSGGEVEGEEGVRRELASQHELYCTPNVSFSESVVCVHHMFAICVSMHVLIYINTTVCTAGSYSRDIHTHTHTPYNYSTMNNTMITRQCTCAMHHSLRCRQGRPPLHPSPAGGGDLLSWPSVQQSSRGRV